MMKKILVLGGDGMLGGMVSTYFKESGYDVKITTLSDSGDYQFDVMKNILDLEKIANDYRPDAIINCIGILNQVAEDHHALAVMANSYLPHYADELCGRLNIKFVHISTDCVFSGDKGEYAEDDFKDTTTFYGQSKALGEIDNQRSLTLRTSIVGPDANPRGIGLFQWFMQQSGPVKGYRKAIWTGVTTLQLAKTIEKALNNNLCGLRHAVNNQKISKYDLISLFNTVFNKKTEIVPYDDYVSNKSLIRKTDFDFEIPGYSVMIEEMRDWIDSHQSLYPEYQRSQL